ncbi:glycosyltransferase [Ectothiorhodospiraceae bacterium 2226]|nr:glycosyltransferase [Ectothiorhodospiraceae bacterium 2226]
MRISVIIPCLNAADTIGVQLEALARQTWAGWWELIAVDNGSHDGTAERVAREARRLGLSRCRVVTAATRRGAAHARNAGSRWAQGNVLAFVDADDEMGPGWLEAVASALQTQEIVASRLEYTRLNDRRSMAMRGKPQEQGLQHFSRPRFLPHAAGAGLAVRRELHERLGGFDEDLPLLEDTDYCWRAQLAGATLGYAPDAVMHYRLRADVRGACRQARQWAQYNVELYRRYRDRGMGTMPWRKGLREWWRLVRRSPEVLDPELRGRWLWNVNWAWGRLWGSLRRRIWAL